MSVGRSTRGTPRYPGKLYLLRGERQERRKWWKWSTWVYVLEVRGCACLHVVARPLAASGC